jgi:glycerol uptake facilitator-like aquaporin
MTPNDRYLYRKLLAEFLGTAYLTATVCLIKGYNEAVPAIIVAVSAATGFISGGFFNPAIVFGAFIKSCLQKDINLLVIRLYVVIVLLQFLGAVTGAYYAWAISGRTLELTKNPDCHDGGAFLSEVVGSANLVAMALMVQEHRPNILVAVICLAGGVLATIQWDTSGAVLNPALALGVKIADVSNHDMSRFDVLWIYMTAPLAGAVVGSLLNHIWVAELKSQQVKEVDKEIPLEEARETPLIGINKRDRN